MSSKRSFRPQLPIRPAADSTPIDAMQAGLPTLPAHGGEHAGRGMADPDYQSCVDPPAAAIADARLMALCEGADFADDG